MPEFESYYWGSHERFRCPAPCLMNYETKEECQACFDKCPRQPKPPQIVERESNLVTAKGAPIVVQEIVPADELDGIEEERPRKRRRDSDATGEP